jgi:nucleoside-diphosphate-sugar epimerase
MKAKCVLVTGASGFIGRPLVPALVSAGYVVRAVTRRPVSFPKAVEAVTIPDLRNSIDWAPILQGVDIIIHLAGMAHGHVPETEYSDVDQINRMATQQLAQAAKTAGVARFVYISSVRAQIGANATHPVSEQDEPCPTDSYGRSKLAAESSVRAAGVPFTILRPVIVYGPHPKGNFKSLVWLASKLLPLPFFGLNNRRSLLGIDNFISAVLFVLNNPSAVGETYLVADLTPLTLPEIVTMLRKAKGRGAGLFYFPPALFRLSLVLIKRRELWARIGEDLVADTTKLRTLGWRPAVDTYEGIVSMIRAGGGSLDSR